MPEEDKPKEEALLAPAANQGPRTVTLSAEVVERFLDRVGEAFSGALAAPKKGTETNDKHAESGEGKESSPATDKPAGGAAGNGGGEQQQPTEERPATRHWLLGK